MKDRKPVEGFISDVIVLKQITIRPGAATDTAAAVALLDSGQVPTDELLGEVFTMDGVEEALALLDRKLPGRDAVRVCLQLA
jgi:threonine dehydrogenase-like Zn-dependent dehydrogenase